MNKDSDFYDININVDSLINLQRGWKIRGYETYEAKKNKRSCVIGIVGNDNRGKSFILQNLVGVNVPSGFGVRTEGLNVKYSKLEDQNYALLNSTSVDTPFVESEHFQLNEDTPEDEAYEKIRLISRDKQFIEHFLQKFVISQSDMLLVVVGRLNASDQKLLNKIKRDYFTFQTNNKMPFVIHNLMNFDTIQQVKDYFDETLNKSLTFKLRENKIINSKAKQGESKTNVSLTYYTEIVKDKNEKIHSIIHLIMARQGTEAGNYYNESSLNFLRHAYGNYTNIDKFPILDRLKDHLFTMSKDIIENPIMKDDVEIDEKTIRLKCVRDSEGTESTSNKIQFKKCIVDELGFPSFISNGLIPLYRYYTKDSNLIIEIEISGKLSTFKTNVMTLPDFHLFRVSGEKQIDEIDSEGMKGFSSIQSGKFVMDIKIPLTDIDLADRKLAKYEKKDGIISLYYDIKVAKEEDEELSYE